jgi:hypothetical protein
VTVRHVVLSVAAVLVLGLGAYLLVEVHASQVDSSGRTSSLPARAAVLAAPSAGAVPAPWRGLPARGRLSDDPPAPGLRQVPIVPDPGVASSGPALDAVLSEASKAYDHGDFADAKRIASRLLASSPTNVSMLRIMVSASCIEGDSAVAQANYAKLPPVEQDQIKIRCARYGVTFPDRPEH